MKKSMVLSICGIVLVFMILQVMSNRKPLYEKSGVFNSKNEAVASFLGHIDSYQILGDGSGYSNTYPKEFMESISLRYRLYIKNNGSRDAFGNIPLMINYSLKEVSDNYIKERYEKTFDLIDKYKRSEEVSYYELSGKGITLDKRLDKKNVNEDGTIKLESIIDIKSHEVEEDTEYLVDYDNNRYFLENVDLYLIVVDEGEGYVIDYYEWIH